MNQDNSSSNGGAAIVPSVMRVKPLASAVAKASGDLKKTEELSEAQAKKLIDAVWSEAHEQ